MAEETTTAESTDVSHETPTQENDGFIPPEDMDEPLETFFGSDIEEEKDEEGDSSDSEDEAAEGEDSEESEEESGEEEKKAEKKKVEGEEDTPKEELHTLKIDGEEQKLTLPQLIERAQKGAAADKRMAEAAELKKGAAILVQNLKKNPLSVLTSQIVGMSEDEVHKLAEDFLYDRYRYEKMSDEERSAFDAQKKLKVLEADKERTERENQERELQQKTEAWQKHYNEQIVEAMKESPLPKNAYAAGRIAYYMLEAVKRSRDESIPESDRIKFTKFTAKHAAKMVEQELKENLGHFLNNDEAHLEDLLGNDVIGKVNKMSVEKLKKKRTAPSGVEMPRQRRKEKILTVDEWREKNAMIAGE